MSVLAVTTHGNREVKAVIKWDLPREMFQVRRQALFPIPWRMEGWTTGADDALRASLSVPAST